MNHILVASNLSKVYVIRFLKKKIQNTFKSWFKTSWQNVATRKKEQGVTFKIEKVCLKYERIKTLSHQVSAMQFTET